MIEYIVILMLLCVSSGLWYEICRLSEDIEKMKNGHTESAKAFIEIGSILQSLFATFSEEQLKVLNDHYLKIRNDISDK